MNSQYKYKDIFNGKSFLSFQIPKLNIYAHIYRSIPLEDYNKYKDESMVNNYYGRCKIHNLIDRNIDLLSRIPVIINEWNGGTINTIDELKKIVSNEKKAVVKQIYYKKNG